MVAFTRNPASVIVLGVGALVLTRVFLVPTEVKSGGSVLAFVKGNGDSGGDASVPDPVLVGALLRDSLTPQAMAAAGLNSGQVSTVVTAVKNTLGANPTALSAADLACDTARANSDPLTRKVQAGLASAEEVAACSQAKQTLTTAETARTALLDAMFTNAIASLTEGQQGTLTRIRANAAFGLPTEYLGTNRSQADWVTLRDALAVKRIATKLGEALDSTTQQTLTGFDEEATTAAAKASLATLEGTVTAAWNQATAH